MKFSLEETIEEMRPIAEAGVFWYDPGDHDSEPIGYAVKFDLGGDLKYLNVVVGLSAVASNYFCVYCKCKKDQGMT